MKNDALGGYLAILLAVIFVLAGIWFAITDPPGTQHDLPYCEYGFTENCEP